MNSLLDGTGALWAKGSLHGKFAGTFFSTGSQVKRICIQQKKKKLQYLRVPFFLFKNKSMVDKKQPH
jgi:multimeric flavodoxin WrbA